MPPLGPVHRPEDTLAIGQVSARTGVSRRLLRYYEVRGLLSPARHPNGHRLFSCSDVERVDRITALLGTGLSTSQIRRVLDCLFSRGSVLVASCHDAREALREHRETLEAQKGAIEEAVEVVDALLGGRPLPWPAPTDHGSPAHKVRTTRPEPRRSA
jgi:DNA-binding transcriptional MerR regulator